MHDIHVHQTELSVIKPIWTAFSNVRLHMSMSVAFGLVFGMPVDMEVWVGSYRVLSPALGRVGRYC